MDAMTTKSDSSIHHFPVLRTQRLTVQLQELSIGASIRLAAMPEHWREAASTAFLRAAMQSAQGVDDPLQWTVQERYLAVAHYLAAVLEDGPDFTIGGGHFTDYLDSDADSFVESHELGEFGGDQWRIVHLTGAMAESIERLDGEFSMTGRLHWIFGGMAAQLVRQGEDIPDFSSDNQRDEWLLTRMRIFAAFPESQFERLMTAYYVGLDALHHLFTINFNDRGIVVMPRKGADGGLPPATFPVDSCLSRTALDLAGQFVEPGGESELVHGDLTERGAESAGQHGGEVF
jgi:hypothetical protein